MALDVYWESDTVVATATFTVNGVATDPTTITFTLRNYQTPIETPYVYGVDGQVSKVSTGVYRWALKVVDAGLFLIRAVGTGLVEAADEAWFEVLDSAFTTA